MQTRFLIPSLLAAASTFALAAKNAEIKPILATPGKVVYESTCDGAALEAPWTMPKGDWQLKDGAIVGKEKAADKHAAVLSLGLPRRDSIIRFSYKLDGAKAFALSINHPKGHLFRVQVNPEFIAVNMDKDKKDAASKAEPLGRATAKSAPGEWHTMQLEIKGAKVTVQTDNGAKVEGSHAGLDVDKTGYRFVVSGESVQLDDLKVWEVAATPAP